MLHILKSREGHSRIAAPWVSPACKHTTARPLSTTLLLLGSPALARSPRTSRRHTKSPIMGARWDCVNSELHPQGGRGQQRQVPRLHTARAAHPQAGCGWDELLLGQGDWAEPDYQVPTQPGQLHVMRRTLCSCRDTLAPGWARPPWCIIRHKQMIFTTFRGTDDKT